MGTIAGGNPGDQIGVAPGATWISAAPIDRGGGISGTVADAILSFEWSLDPDTALDRDSFFDQGRDPLGDGAAVGEESESEADGASSESALDSFGKASFAALTVIVTLGMMVAPYLLVLM